MASQHLKRMNVNIYWVYGVINTKEEANFVLNQSFVLISVTKQPIFEQISHFSSWTDVFKVKCQKVVRMTYRKFNEPNLSPLGSL